MASPAGHRRSMQRPTGKNLKKGICENHNYDNPDTGETGDCPKCASREVQTVNVQRLSDFKCDTCGAKLTPFKEPVKPLKIIVFALLAAIVIVFALGWGLGWFTGAKDDVPVDAPVEAVETPDEDDAAAKAAEEQARLEAEEQARLDAEAQAQRDAEEQARIEAEAQAQKEAAAAASNTRTTTPAVQPASSSVLGGAATLVDNGGYKELRFKRSYTLDLGKNSGEVIYLNAGDKIERAQIHNGILRGGNLRKADGEERAVNGLNVKL